MKRGQVVSMFLAHWGPLFFSPGPQGVAESSALVTRAPGAPLPPLLYPCPVNLLTVISFRGCPSRKLGGLFRVGVLTAKELDLGQENWFEIGTLLV